MDSDLKTETLQAALLGLLILADELSLEAIGGIRVGIVGVVAIAAAKNRPDFDSRVESLKAPGLWVWPGWSHWSGGSRR